MNATEKNRTPFPRWLRCGALIMTMSLPWSANAQSALDGVLNYREYSPLFSTAGQPTREQLPMIKDSGFKRIIYIGFSTVGTAIPEEDQLVKELGMDYLQIPVDFANPTVRDFNAFADAMQREEGTRTLLHCQVNARATAFGLLYRVIYQDVPLAQAKSEMNSVWQPNEVWRDFIFEVLDEHDVSPECEGCDWTPAPPRQ